MNEKFFIKEIQKIVLSFPKTEKFEEQTFNLTIDESFLNALVQKYRIEKQEFICCLSFLTDFDLISSSFINNQIKIYIKKFAIKIKRTNNSSYNKLNIYDLEKITIQNNPSIKIALQADTKRVGFGSLTEKDEHFLANYD